MVASGAFGWTCEGFARGSLEFGGLRWAPLVNLKNLVDIRWASTCYRVKWVGLQGPTLITTTHSQKELESYVITYHFGPHRHN